MCSAVILPTPRQVLLDGGKQPLSHFKREFDVISNHYHHHHEKRLLQDERRLREDSQKKYWRTHDYNLLEGRYYDEEKERQFQARREELAKVRPTPTTTLAGRAGGLEEKLLSASLAGPAVD